MSGNNLVIRPKNRKGEDGYKVFSIRIKEEIVSKIEKISLQTGRSRNELIGMLLEYAVDRCEIKEESNE